MSNLIVVIGATGGQGGGVVNAFLNEVGWKVRGTTRNTSSEKAKALSAKGVEVVSANLNDEESLEKAFQGATAIFAFTDYYETFFELGDEKSLELEFAQGQKIARAAAKNQSLQRLVFSAGPHTSMITNGEAICPHLEGKGRIVTYVTQEMPDLAAKTTFAVFTVFANNALLYDIFKPIYVPSAKKYVTLYPTPPSTPYPCVGDPAVNGGIFVRRLVKSPPPPGSFVRCNVETLTMESYLAAWGRATGLAPEEGATAAVQISPESYVELWGSMGQEQLSQWKFFQWLHDHYPSKWEGITTVEGMDLLTDEDKKELLSVEESLKWYDWSAFEKKPTAKAVTGRFST
ncbi:NmrA-like family domain-containing protein 1 [Colletotrichum aenigma]|uniref:NmrA-like family domain-containing protein 1 n=1 Tax=Colletotrichum aenigma TaxID=1215731 RepID=UPI001872288D|nr:NmrA-like family domain-containing protein 1 [Colletotrichum aenigma]KAF5523445.1 NmrA-like family domain-containing protein 1 [Colletotrichum aenigma]